MKQGGNFLTAHYDWIAAAFALAALVAGGLMFVRSMGTNAGALAKDKVNQIERMTPGADAVSAVDLTDFTRVTKLAEHPTSLSAVTDDTGSFLASEARVSCTNCHVVVARDVDKCPACGTAFAQAKIEDTDADQDGMPNDWEKKYGLNPTDPADAELDKDGDGFTNLEEFEANTNPVDRDFHPDYLDHLKVSPKLNETVLPFFFTGTYKTPSGLKFQFKDPSRAKEYDRGVYSLLAGEEIGSSGFAPQEYVAKTTEKAMGGGMKRKVDISEAIVVRKSDGRKVAMTINRKGIPVDVQATLTYGREGGKTFVVVAGDSIELNGTKYVIKEIKRAGKGVAVTVEHSKLGKIRVLSALEP